MARRFQSRRTPAPRRKTDWIGGIGTAFDTNVLAAGVSGIVTGFDTRVVGSSPAAPFTIVRIRGLLTVAPDTHGTGEDPHGAFGIMIVNGEAFDAGVVSMPSPFTEAFDDRWMYHTYFSVMQRTSAAGDWIAGQTAIVIDSKSMRKVEFGDVLVSVIENGSTVDGNIFNVNFRTLVKTH